jgi:hypothetical protein
MLNNVSKCYIFKFRLSFETIWEMERISPLANRYLLNKLHLLIEKVSTCLVWRLNTPKMSLKGQTWFHHKTLCLVWLQWKLIISQTHFELQATIQSFCLYFNRFWILLFVFQCLLPLLPFLSVLVKLLFKRKYVKQENKDCRVSTEKLLLAKSIYCVWQNCC